MMEYQTIRAREGRGCKSDAFYIELPFRDATGRNESQWRIRARTYRYLERHILPLLERDSRPLDVLDIGAGNGWLSYRLSLRGHRPVAVDLLTNEEDGLGAAAHYAGAFRQMFPRFQAEMDQLPFVDSQFGLIIFNASLHYSEDYTRTMADAVRCLRNRGIVVIADTPWYSNERSGRMMVAERREIFTTKFGFPSDGICSLEFLTDSRLLALEDRFALHWHVHRPWYGVRWALRPVLARLRGRREPSRFRIYVAEVRK
jgi:SAM-dependent methyltransferase